MVSRDFWVYVSFVLEMYSKNSNHKQILSSCLRVMVDWQARRRSFTFVWDWKAFTLQIWCGRLLFRFLLLWFEWSDHKMFWTRRRMFFSILYLIPGVNTFLLFPVVLLKLWLKWDDGWWHSWMKMQCLEEFRFLCFSFLFYSNVAFYVIL